MTPFRAFIEEFPVAKEGQKTFDQKTNVVLVGNVAYMLYRPVTQSPEDKERLVQDVAMLSGRPANRLIVGQVLKVHKKDGTITAQFENLNCPTAAGRLFNIVVTEPQIVWLWYP
jgi:ribosomal protein L35AE/L33A